MKKTRLLLFLLQKKQQVSVHFLWIHLELSCVPSFSFRTITFPSGLFLFLLFPGFIFFLDTTTLLLRPPVSLMTELIYIVADCGLVLCCPTLNILNQLSVKALYLRWVITAHGSLLRVSHAGLVQVTSSLYSKKNRASKMPTHHPICLLASFTTGED